MHEITRGGYPFDDGHCVDCQQDAVVVLFCGGAQCVACVKLTYRAQTWPYLKAAFAQAAQHYDDQRIAAAIWEGVPGMVTSTRTGHEPVTIVVEHADELNAMYAAAAREAVARGIYGDARRWCLLITVPAMRLKLLAELADLYRERRQA